MLADLPLKNLKDAVFCSFCLFGGRVGLGVCLIKSSRVSRRRSPVAPFLLTSKTNVLNETEAKLPSFSHNCKKILFQVVSLKHIETNKRLSVPNFICIFAAE